MKRVLKLGTRGSAMATTQARLVRQHIQEAFPGSDVDIIELVTTGDKKQGTSNEKVRDKHDWISGIEESIFSGEIDFAVHCAKDVPVDVLPGTMVLPVLKRDDPRDIFISRQGLFSSSHLSFHDAPKNALIGSGSLRRVAMLKSLRPDCSFTAVRGNVPTRIEKLKAAEDILGIVVAASGIDRLGLTNFISTYFSVEDVIPAMNQGTLCVQFRADRPDLYERFLQITDQDTQIAWDAEREFIRAIGADCHSAVGAYCEKNSNSSTGFRMLVRVFDSASGEHFDSVKEVNPKDPTIAAKELGEAVLKSGVKIS
jgi:hydroxymethylbilane synthase